MNRLDSNKSEREAYNIKVADCRKAPVAYQVRVDTMVGYLVKDLGKDEVVELSSCPWVIPGCKGDGQLIIYM